MLVSRDCCVAIPLGAMGLSAVCDCDHTHLLILGVIHASSIGFGKSAHLLGLSLRHRSKFSYGGSNGD